MSVTLHGHAVLEARLEYCDLAKKELVLPNPEYRSRMARGASVESVPAKIAYFAVQGGRLFLPREAEAVRQARLIEEVSDERSDGRSVRYHCTVRHEGKFAYQEPGVAYLAKTESGLLVAECGLGKTKMALSALSRVGKTALIVVQDGVLRDQWLGEIEASLGIAKEQVAIIQGSKCDYAHAPIGIAMIQSLSRKDYPPAFWNHWGVAILDECHRTGAATWHPVLGKLVSRTRWGLTATRKRADGLEMLIAAHLGTSIYEVEHAQLKCKVYAVEAPLTIPPELYVQRWNGQPNRGKLLTVLSQAEDRNRILLQTLQEALDADRRILIVGERNAQLTYLHKIFLKAGYKSGLLIGDTPDALRPKILKESRILCVTANYGKQALDVPAFDLLVMATPVSARPPYAELQQIVGRVRREVDGKRTPIVLDIVDTKVPLLVKAWTRRRSWYAGQGFDIAVRRH